MTNYSINNLFITVFTVVLLLSQSQSIAADENSEEAKAAVKAYGTALKGELVAAMESGGPVKAIEVCNVQAPAIAATVSEEKGLSVTRVSLKNRNPHAAPNEWQEEVLLSFEERAASGEDVNALAWSATTETPDGVEYRFMKAIPTGGICLACHGETLAPEIAAELAEQYPEDKAIGYTLGDIRGAFVVTKTTN